MQDVRPDLKELFLNLSRLPQKKGGRTVMFLGGSEGAGASSVAASFGLIAASRSTKASWLIDLDLKNNPLFEAFRHGFNKDIGRPGRAYDASLRVKPIYRISKGAPGFGGRPNPQTGEKRTTKLFTAHQISGTRLMVTRFRNERLNPDETVTARPDPEWWKSLRSIADWVIVDGPSVQKSNTTLSCVSQMDGVVMVVRAGKTRARDAANLKTEIEANGGNILGTVMNAAPADTRLAWRLTQ